LLYYENWNIPIEERYRGKYCVLRILAFHT
jgi:hypothetical protein